MRGCLQRLREEWAASGAALDRGGRARARREQKTSGEAAPEYSAGQVAAMNAATVAGVVANTVVDGGCS